MFSSLLYGGYMTIWLKKNNNKQTKGKKETKTFHVLLIYNVNISKGVMKLRTLKSDGDVWSFLY